MSKLKEWCREAFYVGTDSESVGGFGIPGRLVLKDPDSPVVYAADVSFEGWWRSKNGDDADEADKATREQAARARKRLADVSDSVEKVADLIDDVESRLAACLASPVTFGGQGIRDGALATARAQLARTEERSAMEERACGRLLAAVILELLGEQP